MIAGASPNQTPAALNGSITAAGKTETPDSQAKHVRFQLKRNLYFQQGGAIPSPDLRTPDSCRPKVTFQELWDVITNGNLQSICMHCSPRWRNPWEMLLPLSLEELNVCKSIAQTFHSAWHLWELSSQRGNSILLLQGSALKQSSKFTRFAPQKIGTSAQRQPATEMKKQRVDGGKASAVNGGKRRSIWEFIWQTSRLLTWISVSQRLMREVNTSRHCVEGSNKIPGRIVVL